MARRMAELERRIGGGWTAARGHVANNAPEAQPVVTCGCRGVELTKNRIEVRYGTIFRIR